MPKTLVDPETGNSTVVVDETTEKTFSMSPRKEGELVVGHAAIRQSESEPVLPKFASPAMIEKMTAAKVASGSYSARGSRKQEGKFFEKPVKPHTWRHSPDPNASPSKASEDNEAGAAASKSTTASKRPS